MFLKIMYQCLPQSPVVNLFRSPVITSNVSHCLSQSPLVTLFRSPVITSDVSHSLPQSPLINLFRSPVITSNVSHCLSQSPLVTIFQSPVISVSTDSMSLARSTTPGFTSRKCSCRRSSLPDDWVKITLEWLSFTF